jgi:hypothetical protein
MPPVSLRIDVNRDMLMKLGSLFLVNRARLGGHLDSNAISAA